MVHQDLASIYDDLVTPVLHEIGGLWASGNLSIPEEHIASQVLKDAMIKMQEVVNPEQKGLGRAFVLTLSEEMHDIPAKMVQHVLEARGFQVFYSGQKTVLENLDEIFNTFRPDRVYVSSTFVENSKQASDEFNYLGELCQQRGLAFYAGGTGLEQLETSVSFIRLQRFWDVMDL